MVVYILGILIGFVIAAFSGGKISDIRRQPLALWWTLPVALVCFVLPYLVDNLHGAGTMHALGYASLMAFGVANLQLTGIGVVMVGVGMNLIPLAFNGTVPVSEAAAVTAEIATFDTIEATDLGPARTLESSTQRFIFLGDIIPMNLIGQVYSFGDLIIAFGLANMMYRTLKPRQVRFDDEEAGWPDSSVPTGEVSSDPWTAMLRGEINEDDFATKTGAQQPVVAVAPESNEWMQEPPVDTGPMMIMGQPDQAQAAPEASAQPEALDLSLTWADEPQTPDSSHHDAAALAAAAAAGAAVASQSQPDSEAEPPAEAVEEPAAAEPTSPFAPPPAAAEPEPEPATPVAASPPVAPPEPQQAPQPEPSPPPVAPPEPQQAPEPEPPAALFDQEVASPTAASGEGRSFAPELPDMNDTNSGGSAFSAALAAFDDGRSDYGSESDTPAAPEHDTGPMPIVTKPDESQQ